MLVTAKSETQKLSKFAWRGSMSGVHISLQPSWLCLCTCQPL